jgi:hypothetical protein
MQMMQIAWRDREMVSFLLHYILNAREKKNHRAGVRKMREALTLGGYCGRWSMVVAAAQLSAAHLQHIERRMSVGCEGPRGAATDSSSKKRISMHVWPRRRPPRN